jgi:hypothetical protein
MLPFDVTIPAIVPQRLEFPDGLMNYPVYAISQQMHCSDSLLVSYNSYNYYNHWMYRLFDIYYTSICTLM